MKKLLPVILALLVGGVAGYEIRRYEASAAWGKYKPAQVVNKTAGAVDFGKFWMVWDKVSASYVDKAALDSNKMVEGAIGGMVGAIGDPYTTYLTGDQNKAEKDSLGGEFEGVGIQLGYKDIGSSTKKLIVVAPLEGTPAKRAGVRAGDMILRIKDAGKNLDRDTAGIALPEAVALIRGKKGTSVVLVLARDQVVEPINVELLRDTIVVKSVELEFVEAGGSQIAWLKVARFGDRTQVEWDEAVTRIKNQENGTDGSRIEGVVVDLRNNPGGYLEGSVYATSEFLVKGKNVVKQQFGDGTSYDNKVSRQGRLTRIPLVVLINEGSASAAEIMAGAIADHNRGKIVGVKSFGKGSVQQPEDFPDGSGLHTTVARWLTPAGTWIDKNGIGPDVEVSLDGNKEINNPADDDQLQKALELL